MGSSIAVSSTLGEGSTFTFPLRVLLVPEDKERPLYPDMPEET
jgi:light-regulated signal transduction histidine kinase (bacteriophytochrome)